MTRARLFHMFIGVIAVAALAGFLLAITQLRQGIADQRLARALDLAPRALNPPLAPDWTTGAQHLLVAGDSRVAQWQPVPDIPGHDIVFSGIGGETTRELRNRLHRDLPLYAPQTLVVAAGINDLVAASLNPGQADMILDGLLENLVEITATARAGDAQVILCTIPRPARPDPLRRLLAWSDSLPGLVDTANDRIRGLASADGSIQILDLDTEIGGESLTPLSREYSTDTLHLSTTAYAQMNELLTGALRE